MTTRTTPSVAVYVPVSLNRPFATMMHMLCRSLRRNAALPGAWKVVFTVSRDPSIELDAPVMGWTAGYPVEFRWVEPELWEKHHWVGTANQWATYEFDTDVVLFMDADTLAVGPLTEIVLQSAAADEFAAWPAWQPPSHVDLDALLLGLGFPPRDYGIEYSGYGIGFMSPRSCPPYFNAGFVAMSGRLANRMARTYRADFDTVSALTTSNYRSQIALTVNLLRNGYAYRALDMRYNLSNGDSDGPAPFDDPASHAAMERAWACIADQRVMHYCVQSKEFQRQRDFDGMEALHDFCLRTPVNSGNRRLQGYLSDLLAD